MFRAFVACFSILSLLVPGHLCAIECKNPFASFKEFQLIEKLKCNGVTSPVLLRITPVNISATNANPYLGPGCDKASTYFNLFQETQIIDFSDTMTSAHAEDVRVSRACDGNRLFRLDRKPLLFTTPSGKKVNTSIRVYAEDMQLTLIGYAQANEDTANSLIVRGIDDQVLFNASKSLRNIPSDGTYCAEAVWTVNNVANTEQTATIVSYLLTLKDNIDFSCEITAPTQAPGMSSGGAIALGVALGALAVVAGGVGVAFYCMRNNPRYDKVRLIN